MGGVSISSPGGRKVCLFLNCRLHFPAFLLLR